VSERSERTDEQSAWLAAATSLGEEPARDSSSRAEATSEAGAPARAAADAPAGPRTAAEPAPEPDDVADAAADALAERDGVAPEATAEPADAVDGGVSPPADAAPVSDAREPLLDMAGPPPPALVELAHAHGVATEFWDWQGRHTTPSTRTIVAILAALDVDASTHAAVETALAEVRLAPWRRVLPHVVVTREDGTDFVGVHVEHEQQVEVWVDLEDGGTRPLTQTDRWVDPRVVDGRMVGEATFAVPEDLPLGWHTLRARHPGGESSCPLVVTPRRLELPPALAERRAWGFAVQLYSLRSEQSWGLGDLADLAEFACWSARSHGAGFVLVNPLHAAEPVPPMEASPYLPTTRRFVNPVYLRVEDIREVAYLPSTERAIVEWQAEAVRELNTAPGPLDRDAVWAAKKAALESVFAHPRSPARQAEFEDYCAEQGQGLLDFATWCALAERYGLPVSRWPAHALEPRSRPMEQMREELADRIDFHRWLQWCADEQLARAQQVARESGMSVGIIHDLAVGVHPRGADAWAMSDVLACDVTAGAPPDAFNQQGQDWSQPPWRPDRLAERGYAPFRDMVRSVLRHSGGLRVDHIVGLFRLWWVPAGLHPSDGTYVRYDHEALVGILALEAHRAGAFVIGEDLGTVEPWAREYLRERGLLGTSVLWFERDGQGRPLRPERWRDLALATVTTHDLPPTASYLAGEHIELRERLGLLTRPVEQELVADTADRAGVIRLLQELGLLGESASERDAVEALHRFLTWTPARLIGVALADAVGDRRAMNLPGTDKEYPNWRLPLADGVGQPLLLSDVMASIRVAGLARCVSGA
jgi:4-alpha-glucanotransferase